MIEQTVLPLSLLFTGIIHDIIQEKDSITLCCPHPVGQNVMWSRKRGGNMVDVLLVSGDRDIKPTPDPHKHYSSLADKSLFIFKANVSHSGTYHCNNKPAAEVTVNPSHPR